MTKPYDTQRNSEAVEGLRFNGNKIRVDLIPWEWIAGLANLLTIGSVKYAPRNWEKGLSYTDTMASLKRHLLAWERGEDYDPETKSHHMVSVAWNALVLFSMQIRGIGKKDLPRENYKGITADDAAD